MEYVGFIYIRFGCFSFQYIPGLNFQYMFHLHEFHILSHANLVVLFLNLIYISVIYMVYGAFRRLKYRCISAFRWLKNDHETLGQVSA